VLGEGEVGPRLKKSATRNLWALRLSQLRAAGAKQSHRPIFVLRRPAVRLVAYASGRPGSHWYVLRHCRFGGGTDGGLGWPRETTFIT
jgi:hypothetical protein